MAYSNPYLNMLPSVQQVMTQQQQQILAPLQQQANALNAITQVQPMQQMPMQQQQQVPIQQPMNNENTFVTKEEFNQLLEENKKLKDQLEKELTQRSDMEFFKKEQEVLKLDEGRRAFQEVEYSKQQYFTMLWKTSPMGKDAMTKYRDTVDSIYQRYAEQPATPIQQGAVQQVPIQATSGKTPAPEKQVVEEPQKKYNVVNKSSTEVDNK